MSVSEYERHEPVQDGDREHCATCWRAVEVSAPPGEVRYRASRAPWPCENAALRARTEALTNAGREAEKALDIARRHAGQPDPHFYVEDVTRNARDKMRAALAAPSAGE